MSQEEASLGKYQILYRRTSFQRASLGRDLGKGFVNEMYVHLEMLKLVTANKPFCASLPLVWLATHEASMRKQ